MIGMDCLLLWIAKPMSSANALRVDVVGSCLASLSIRGSIHRTKRVGDIGQPCRTPDWRVMDGKSLPPIRSWCLLL